jgi:diguanylate cyclase (GGDEF)-like protein
MGRLSRRVLSGVVLACLFFAGVATAIGTAGIVGVHSATAAGNVLANDELQTATVTAQFDHSLGVVNATASAMFGTTTSAGRQGLLAPLYDTQIPAVELSLAQVERIHEGDSPHELAEIALLRRQWVAVRIQLTPAAIGSEPGPLPATEAGAFVASYGILSTHVQALIGREDVDARSDQADASAKAVRAQWGIAGAVLVAVAASSIAAWVLQRRVRLAFQPAREQIEFAETLQLAEDEPEAHQLLQQHLERLVPASAVTVLNRNNSADRLEAVTRVPDTSPLHRTLANAAPRSCLAIRSARPHEERPGRRAALLSCQICAQDGGHSSCTPLTVGGEVIGSVLVTRPADYGAAERQQVRDSVAQAAPVLANLRNLAIAELRAATDSLTGLPNKRAMADTLKRLLAQASRAMEPMSLLMLDLDHFKDINDKFGHPVGDQALAGVGAALRSAIRAGDLAARNGGEEFAVLLPATGADGAVAVAEKIRAAIADISLPANGLHLTASVGIATYPEHGTSTESLERLADAALYVAKRSGRDRVETAVLTSDDGVPALEDWGPAGGSAAEGQGRRGAAGGPMDAGVPLKGQSRSPK